MISAILVGVLIIACVWLAYKWVTKNDKNKPTPTSGGGTGGNGSNNGDVIQ